MSEIIKVVSVSQAYEVITYGGGELLTEIFNGIVTAIGENSYTTLLRISALSALTWILLESAFRNNVMLSMRWLLGFIFIYNVLLVPKTSIQIVDRIQHNHMTTVAHVPWGLAFFASLASSMGDNLTQLTEKNFNLPDDLKYSETGTLMASNLVKTANHFEITNATFAHNIREYMQQCVFYDIYLNKYALQDLISAPDLWELFTNNASPARAFLYNDQIMTCQRGIAQLTKDWQTELLAAGKTYGKRLFSHDSIDPKGQLLKYLPISYKYLSDLSEDASTLMRQAMLANALEQNLINHTAQNAATRIRTYAISRAQDATRSTYQVTGELAARWLPIMKNVFEALLYGAFVFLFLLMLLPIGISIFRAYILAIFWVQSWPPLYAILNLVMSLDAKSNSLAATQIGDKHVLSLATLSGLDQVNSDAAALAGYLAMSIPFIAYGIVKGGAGSLTQLTGYISQATQSAVASATNEAITGNITMGNTQISNHSANNTSANHINMNASLELGMTSYQLPSGAMIHRTPDGKNVIDNRSTTISNTGTNLHLSDAIREAANEQYDHAITASQTQLQASAKSMASTLRKLNDLVASRGKSVAVDDTAALSQSTSYTNSVQQVKDLTHRFAIENRLTDNQAVQILGIVTAGASVIGGDANQQNTIYGMNINAGIRGHIQGLTESQRQQAMHAGQEFVNKTNFSETLENAVRATHDQHYRSGTEQSQRLIDSISNSYDQAITYRQEAMHSLNTANSYHRTINYVNENASVIDSNYNQAMVGTIQQTEGILKSEAILNDPQKGREYARQFAKMKLQELQSTISAGKTLKTEENIVSDYKQNAFSNEKEMIAFDKATHDAIENKAVTQSISACHPINQQILMRSQAILNQDKNRVKAKHEALEKEGAELSSQTVQNTDPKRHNLASRTFHQAGEAIKSIFTDDE